MASTTFNAALDGQRLRLFQFLLVATVLLALVIDGIDIQLLSLVSPVIIKQWGIDRAAFGPALSGALVGMGLGASAGGWLGDRLGRRNVLIAAILLFGLATIAASHAGNIAQMTALRALSGFGFGAAGPCALALATEWLPRRARPQAVALLSVGTPMGGMAVASLILLILPRYGWSGAFVLCGSFTLPVALLCALIVRESPTYLMARGRQAEAERMAARIFPTGLSLLPEAEPGEATSGARAGMFDPAYRRLSIGAGVAFLSASAVAYAFQVWTPVLLTGAGFSLPQAVSATFAYNFMSVLGALSAGFANRWLGSRFVLRLASAGMLACVLGLAVVIQSASGPPGMARQVGVILLDGGAGGFASLSIATLYTMMVLGYAPACRATGIGFGMLAGRVGGIATSYAGGYLLDLVASSLWPFFGALGLGAACVWLGSVIADRHVLSARAERRLSSHRSP